MKLNKYLILVVSLLLVTGCSKSDKTSDIATNKLTTTEENTADPMANIGIGPISNVDLSPEIDQILVVSGKEIYDLKCTACHKATEKFIGPAPAGIMERRNPAWIMNMILNPVEMTLKDPVARALLIEYNGAPMANQSLTEEEARAILEYFRIL
ncbi:MAG: cytochrome c [Candidatus Neomarinimicrobiota bacterium]